MNKKILVRIGSLLFLAVAVSLALSGCGQKSVDQKSETSSDGGKIAGTTGTDCSAGFSKTVAGLKYQRTGIESHAIQGRTIDLCCWYQVDNQAQKKKKICGDKNESPIGYDNGILWEIEKGTGNTVKAMETYQKDGKSCQQHYEKDGLLGPESCK